MSRARVIEVREGEERIRKEDKRRVCGVVYERMDPGDTVDLEVLIRYSGRRK